MNKKELVVSAIENGTVIDHIPAQNLFKVISVLGLDDTQDQITFGTNLTSARMGRKAIIKVAGRFLADEQISMIALLAPTATINTIRNYGVVERREAALPEEVRGVTKCMNPKCVTNNYEIPTRFRVLGGERLALKCHYCEKVSTELIFK